MSESDATQPGSPDDELLVPLDALEAAWQEVEAVQRGAADADATGADATDAPAEADPGPGSSQEPACKPSDTQAGGDEQAATRPGTPARPAGKGMRFVVGKRKSDSDAGSSADAAEKAPAPAAGTDPQARTAADATPADAARPASGGPVQPPARARTDRPQPFIPRVPWWKRLLRAIDDLLDVINRPFAGLSPQVRSLIGTVSLTAILVSLASAWLIPTLLPHRDAITFLEAARARVLSQSPQSASPTGERAERPASGPEQDSAAPQSVRSS